jgi:3',5'-cyclic AMP phosphodiesterase CpdA
MLTWLNKDLAATTQKWIIAYWHHPPYSKGSYNSDRERRLKDIRKNILRILESYGVDLVLNGHSHSYERSFLLHGHYGTSDTLTKDMLVDNSDGRADGNGVYRKGTTGAVHVVVDSSGKTGKGSLDHPVMHVSLMQLRSLVLLIDGDKLDATFIDDTGRIRDYFTILKSS